MKVKTLALIVIVLFAVMVAAQKPLSLPTAWYALEANTSAFHSWTPADPNFEFDLSTSILPVGFNIEKTVDNKVAMSLDPGPAGEQQAMVVVTRQQEIGGSWTGPKVTQREEAVIVIIRYSSTIDPFFGGQGHVILSASDPNV